MPMNLMGFKDKKDYTIHLCAHCGEKCKSKYCGMCQTAEGRKKVDIANKKIRMENEAKGYKYAGQ
jgi:hypothetical protein